METQEIIVYIILAICSIIVAFRVYKSIFVKSSGGCDGCSSDCSHCSLSDVKKQIEI
jgi:Fe-S cluster biogenesis protein NfuA